MTNLALLAALLLPTSPQADPSEGVLGHTWGEPSAALAGERSSTRLELSTGDYTPRCHRTQPPDGEPLEGTLRSVELCYHDDGLFLVELNLSPARVWLAEDILREKYGEPTLSEQGGNERNRGHGRERSERASRSHRQTMEWSADEVSIQLEGWRVRYLHLPTADDIETSMQTQAKELREQLRTVL